MTVLDPNVWTGGALQEKSVRMEEFGLASMYPACGAHWAPGHHGVKRACDLISRLASIGLFGSPVLACAGKTVAPFLPFSLADLGGEIGSQADMFMVLPVFSYFFCSTAPQAFSRPDRGKPRPARADAVKAGRDLQHPSCSRCATPALAAHRWECTDGCASMRVNILRTVKVADQSL